MMPGGINSTNTTVIFLVNYAKLAEEAGVDTLLIGGEWLQPAMSQGLLSNGESSGAPDDANNKWFYIVDEVRANFSGDL